MFLYQCLTYADCHVRLPVLISFLSLERESSTSVSSAYVFTLYVLSHLIRRFNRQKVYAFQKKLSTRRAIRVYGYWNTRMLTVRWTWRFGPADLPKNITSDMLVCFSLLLRICVDLGESNTNVFEKLKSGIYFRRFRPVQKYVEATWDIIRKYLLCIFTRLQYAQSYCCTILLVCYQFIFDWLH